MGLIVLKVKGITDEDDERRIKDAIELLEDVDEATANWEEEIVVVKSQKDVKTKDIVSIIEDIGYYVEEE